MIAPAESTSEAYTVTTPPAAASSAAIVPFSLSRFQELIDAHRLKATEKGPRLVIVVY
jgi:hypothetical protein